MNEKVNPSFSFDKDSLIIVFDKIVTYQTERVNPESLPEDFEVEEDVYQLTIKQQDTEKNTVTYAIESVLNEFKIQFNNYLNYKLKNESPKNEYTAKILSDTSCFFDSLQDKVRLTLEEIKENSEKQINESANRAEDIFNKNKVINQELNEELNKLKSLHCAIEEFIIEESDASLDGEILVKESCKEK